MTIFGSACRRVVGIPQPRRVFSRPGLPREAWQRFGPVAESLALGYNATLEDSSESALEVRLQGVDQEFSGFAYEGAGMGLGALDLVAPWKNRINSFVEGPGARHIYTVYVGLGLALARMKRNPQRHLDRLDPLLGMAIVDGYGFHGGFFEWRRYIDGTARPSHLPSSFRHLFDQGLGRAIWFSGGAMVDPIARTVHTFQEDRHADLWNGVGMACAYGGGADQGTLDRLCEVAADYTDRLAWGAATAAWTRNLAGNPCAHTDLACERFAGMSADQAARLLDDGRAAVTRGEVAASISLWRSRFAAAVASG